VHDVDQEREMWLNSFYKSPLRIPMPAELEHWWSKGIQTLCIALVKFLNFLKGFFFWGEHSLDCV
jgi:hypothetical protein